MLKLLNLIAFLIISNYTFAAGSTGTSNAPKTSGGGDWNNSLSWTGTAPGCPVGNGTYVIKTGDSIFITTPSACSPFSLSGNITITVQAGAVLYIPSDVSITGNVNFDIKSGGKVIIKGNLNLGGSSTLSTTGNGTLQVWGNVNDSGNGNTFDCSGVVQIQGTGCAACNTGSGCTQNVTLPLTLTSFNVISLGDDGVEITWTTTNESNIDYLTLQRSPDVINWENIVNVSSQNNKILNSYKYVDSNPLSGTAYYRLRETDLNGAISYYQVKATSSQNENLMIDIVPNPTSSSQFVIVCNFNTEVTIYDLMGKLIHSQQLEIGKNNINLNAPSGTYVVKAISTNSETNLRLILK